MLKAKLKEYAPANALEQELREQEGLKHWRAEFFSYHLDRMAADLRNPGAGC